MTHQEIRDAIAASPELQAFRADGNFEGIAVSLSSAPVGIVKAGDVITTRGAAARFPPLGGLPNSLAFQLAHRKLKTWATPSVASTNLPTSLLADAILLQLAGFEDKGLDFGEPELRNMLDYLSILGVISVEEAAGFKALANAKDSPISWQQVRSAVEGI